MSRRNKKNAVFSDILTSLSKYFKIGVLVMTAAICLSGIRFVKSGNVALVLRFGHLVGNTYEEQVHEPGLLLAFPYIIDEVVIVPTGSVIEQKITTHYTAGEMKSLQKNGYLITGDQNIVVISATAKYKITDPVKYALSVSDAQSVINATVSNAMVESAACMPVDDILTSGKEEFSKKAIKIAQEKLDRVGMGISLKNLELTKVSMPKEIVDIYNQVNAASVKASTMLEEAYNFRDTTIPKAQAEAQKLISAANSEYSSSISTANKALAEFNGLKQEYVINKEAVKTRVYNEKVSEILKKIGEVKVVQDGDSKIIIN